jgi:hypothetical protein
MCLLAFQVALFDSEIRRCATDMSINEHARLVEQVAASMANIARLRAKVDSSAPPPREEGGESGE